MVGSAQPVPNHELILMQAYVNCRGFGSRLETSTECKVNMDFFNDGVPEECTPGESILSFACWF